MSRQIPNQLMQLSYPQHVAEFPTYEDAQAAVDYLADKRFAVQNILIVGTNLKMLERVTGRRTWGTVLGQGAISGISTGLFVPTELVPWPATADHPRRAAVSAYGLSGTNVHAVVEQAPAESSPRVVGSEEVRCRKASMPDAL